MKKMVTYLAALGMLASLLPTNAVYAAGINIPDITPVIAEAQQEDSIDPAAFLFAGHVSVDSDTLNLRSEPNTSSVILASIPDKTVLSLYRCGTDGWYKTIYNNKVGYVSSLYITEEKYPDIDQSLLMFTGIVNTGTSDRLNFRSEPNTKSTIIASLENGTKLPIYMCDTDGWYMAVFGNKTGYVSADYISRTPDTSLIVKGDDIAGLAGQWIYYSPSGQNDIGYGQLTIRKDGSFMYINNAGDVSGGFVFKEFNDNVPYYALYQDNILFMTIDYTSKEPNKYYVDSNGDFISRDVDNGNGFFSNDSYTLPTENSVNSLKGGIWRNPDNSSEILRVEVGKYQSDAFVYTDGKNTVKGTVFLEYRLNAEGYRQYFYNFYEYGTGNLWNSFNAKGEVPLVNLSSDSGKKRFVREKDTSKGVSIKDIAGQWKYQQSSTGYEVALSSKDSGDVIVKEDGTFTFLDMNGKSVSGTVKAETETFADGTVVPLFNFYDGTALVFSCYYDCFNTDILAVGNLGVARMVRGKEVSYEITAIEKMDALSLIYLVDAGGGVTTENGTEITINGHQYSKVSDFQSVRSPENLKDLINNTCAGKFKEGFLSDIDNRFVEKDGVYYALSSARGSINFETSKGVVITEISENKFTAVTIAANNLHGQQKAEFVLENGKWLVNKVECGEYDTKPAVTTAKSATTSTTTSTTTTITSSTTTVTTTSTVPPKGDINGDKTINLKDVVILRRYIAGGWGVTLDENIADVNNDGAVNLKDVVLLRRYIAGGWGVEL